MTGLYFKWLKHKYTCNKKLLIICNCLIDELYAQRFNLIPSKMCISITGK